jgi:hypothetical protein
MKTTNIVLIGVVGVGAVGAYMYMKNKKAQDNLLSGSLPAKNKGGATLSGTPPKSTPPKGNAPSGTTATNTVFLPSGNDLKLVEATVLLGKIKSAQLAIVDSKKPFTGRKETGNYGVNQFTQEYKTYLLVKEYRPKALKGLMIELHNLDYELDANNNLVKLDPNRDKQKSLKALNLQYEIIQLKEKSKEPFEGRKFIDSYSNNDNSLNWTSEYKNFKSSQAVFSSQLTSKMKELENLDYTLDANNNLVKLDPNRNKEWIRVQELYLSLVNLDKIGLAINSYKVKELATYGYKIDPTTKKLVTI